MSALELRGVFGVDFILHDGSPCVVEVNPRYPASVEVLEHATGKAVFCPQTDAAGPPGLIGKAIYLRAASPLVSGSGPLGS